MAISTEGDRRIDSKTGLGLAEVHRIKRGWGFRRPILESPFGVTEDIPVKSVAGYIRRLRTSYRGGDAVSTVIVDETDTAPCIPSD